MVNRAGPSLSATKEMRKSNHMHSAPLKFPILLTAFREYSLLFPYNFFPSTLLCSEDMT